MKSAKNEGRQTLKASAEEETLTKHLMEKVCGPSNLNQAYKRVKANRGAAGVDGMTIDELSGWIAKHKESLIESLLTGSYQPQPVLGVEIPKPGNKGFRQLGVPCRNELSREDQSLSLPPPQNRTCKFPAYGSQLKRRA
jgi:RNA-directed DNA polymerase